MNPLSIHTRIFSLPDKADTDFLFLLDGSFDVWTNVRLRVKPNTVIFWDRFTDVRIEEQLHECFDRSTVQSVVASLAVLHCDFLNRCGIEVDLDGIQKIEVLELPTNFDGGGGSGS